MKIRSRLILIILLVTFIQAFAQDKEQKFSARQLNEDLSYFKKQIYNVHIEPFNELKQEQFDRLFADMGKKIKDSLTASEFFSIIRPAIGYLGDEHADVRTPKGFDQSIFLPFSILKKGNQYLVETSFSEQIKPGIEIKAIDEMPVSALLEELMQYTSGFAEERLDKAMQQFGYLYALAKPKKNTFRVSTNQSDIEIKAVDPYTWTDYLKKIYGVASYKERIAYQKYNETGYIKAASFGTRGDEDFKKYELAIDSIFSLIQRDQVKQLVIDVSENSGGNSAIGDLIINKFYRKPYKSYQANWKRSDEYLQLMKSYGNGDDQYEKLKPGATLHYDPEMVNPTATKDIYTGKVYILVGDATFSSAMMFATTIKDNSIALLIGKSPKNGHPSHYGELYGFKLPNTQLNGRFGVKEWIRPAGKGVKNVLTPDVTIDPRNLQAVLDMVGKAERQKF